MDVKLNIEVAEMKKDISYIKQEQDEIKILIKESNFNIDKKLDHIIDEFKTSLKEHENYADNKFDKLNEMYAPKWIETWFWTFIGLSTTIISAIIVLILSK